ncbi:hypothetical protein DF185_09515 [Marinifilum breve]|uniref:HTH araC/xylS-type domain-containing protein n=1 Tax=Marinifilum breve TaxID=2184082 RepID=A0A2V3ZZE1_9BACT|nr:AraC family transcriptional regulator [Marinifilum breve]PXY01696.1 hypothetical protein DF185_09515 [Marinifilum breve]
MRGIKLIVTICFQLIVVLEGFAAEKEFRFKKLNSSNGLNSNVVYSIFQDTNGFLWFGTKEGLNRYDGLNITPYLLPDVPFSESVDKRINGITQDKDGMLWIATQLGVVSINIDSAKAKYYALPYETKKSQSRYANDIVVSEDNLVWVGTRNGLYHLNRTKDEFEIYKHFPFNSKIVSYSKGERIINNLCFDKDGRLWIGTAGNGVTILDISKNKKQIFKRSSKRKSGELSSNFIEDIYKDRENRMWIASASGLNLFDESKEEFQVFRHKKDNKNSLSDNYVTGIAEDKSGNIWLGTKTGLNLYDTEQNRFYHYLHHPMVDESISSNNVLSVLAEKSGSVWIGSMQGLNHFVPDNLIFQLYQNTPGDENSLVDNTLRAAIADKEGNVWLGTMRHGISLFNSKNKIFKQVEIGKQIKGWKKHKNVRTAYYDVKGNILFGTDKGVLKYNTSKREFEAYPSPKKLNFRKGVFEILQDDEGNYWFAELDKGIWKWNPNKKASDLYNRENNGLTNLNVKVMTQMKNGDIWAACHMKGLCVLKKGEKNFKAYRSGKTSGTLSSDKVYAIFQDSKNRIWIATGMGLNLYNDTTDSFQVFDEKNGLAGNVVLSIQEDEKGRLWLGTNRGMSCFNVEERQFANFYQEDGLQGNIFEYKVACKAPDGLMYFGGNNGLNSFDPLKFEMNDLQPELKLISVKAEESEAKIKGNELQVYHTYTGLNLQLASMSFCEPEKNRIQYKLESDSIWKMMPMGSQKISLPVLPVGTYKLDVMASNNHMRWSEPVSMLIQVKRDWLEYIWIIYLLVIFVLIFVFAKLYLKKSTHKGRKKTKEKADSKLPVKNGNTKIWNEEIDSLENFMKDNTPYRDKRLTKAQLAGMMDWSEVQLSNVLRDGLQVSFNDFVNAYRVDEVKQKLKDPQNKDFTLLAIAEDCGFNSKTSFYRIFKKFTDLTPSEYLEQFNS